MHFAVYRFFDSESCKVTTQLSDITDMIPNYADVSFALLLQNRGFLRKYFAA